MLTLLGFALVSCATTAMPASTAGFTSLKKIHSYVPPEWTTDHLNPTTTPLPRLQLAHLPTPIYQPTICKSSEQYLSLSILHKFLAYDVTFLIKRDDMTGGVELGGNKVRKLEFLLAQALEQGCDSVVTIGGQQSNHCRATACAARALGLEPHIVLRKTSSPLDYTGNLLLDRMVGAKIYTCTPGEYGRVGSDEIVRRLCRHLRTKEGKNVYAIPVGGSNAVGTWGYIQAVKELESQVDGVNSNIDHVVLACGSGGTAAGIALGLALCPTLNPQVHAIAVCDDPDYFYRHAATIAGELGLHIDSTSQNTANFIKKIMRVHQGKGLGYARSTPEELRFCTDFALETGVVLDPVYAGKALFHFFTYVFGANPEAFRGSTILFWHTGGAIGMYDKTDDLSLGENSIRRLCLYDSNPDHDGLLI